MLFREVPVGMGIWSNGHECLFAFAFLPRLKFRDADVGSPAKVSEKTKSNATDVR